MEENLQNQGNGEGKRPTPPPPPPPGYRAAGVQQKKSKWWIPVVIIVGVFVLLGLFLSALFNSFTESLMVEEEVKVKDNSVLYLTLSGGVQEYADENPFAELFGNSNPTSLTQIVHALEVAAEDDDIKGLYIKPKASIGMIKSEEVLEAIEKFKESGKFVYAFLETGNEMTYKMALPADKIFMPTEGLLEMNGLSIGNLFFGDMLEKIGVEYYVQQFEEYKSAGETFSRNGYSDKAKEQLQVILDSRFDSLLTTIQKYRNIDPESVREDMASGVYTADSVLDKGYIDGYITEASLRRELAKMADDEEYTFDPVTTVRSGYSREEIAEARKAYQEKSDDEKDEDPDLNLISVKRYLKGAKKNINEDKEIVEDTEIAVIYGTGPISSGFQSSDPFGGGSYEIKSGTFIKHLKKARENDKIKAVILRIDSPGGSVIASDEIWEEIYATRMVKPVYASMSDVAASGGYYMAMACDSIFAHPQTITGSIGVILAIPNFSEAMDDIGLNYDAIKTSPNADFMNPLDPMTESDKAKLQELSESIYMRFITRAAESRGMEVEELRQLAKGRVWTGTDAKSNGLVDVLGGLDEAIDYAKAAIGVEEGKLVRVRRYPETKDNLEEFLEDIFNKKEEDASAINKLKQGIAKFAGISSNEFAMTWNLLPETAKKELIYAYQLAQIAKEEKAMYVLPQFYSFN
ncbi:MAG: signal peptide peptidase SppA [Candidatus Kapaibacteriales bacterium]